MRASLPASWSLLGRRVAIDLRDEALYWAESSWGAKGLRLRRWGRVDRGDGEVPDQLVERVAGTRLVRGAEIAVPIHHPELRIHRLELPALSKREARQVVSRREREIGYEVGEGASCGSVRSRRKGAHPVWLIGCPPQFSELEEQRWNSLGLPIHRFASRHLALGNLGRVLPLPDAGELLAIFDLGANYGTCVLLDAEGWVFGRDVPLKLAGERLLCSVPGDEVGLDPLERSVDQAELLANELHRTFHYVQTELRFGMAARLVLSGESEDLPALGAALEGNLGFEVRLLGDAIREGPAAGAHPGSAVALGLALSVDERSENLLPAPTRRALARRRARSRLAATAALAGVAVLAGAAQLGITRSSVRQEIARFDAAWESRAEVRRRAEAAASARARAERIEQAIGSIWRPGPPWTGALEALGLLLPDDALVERLTIDHDGTRWNATLHVEFRGEDVAQAADSVSRFAAELGESPLWAVRSLEREPMAPGPSGEGPEIRMRFRIGAELASTRPTVSARGEPDASAAGGSHG
jgi:hypothetical protein